VSIGSRVRTSRKAENLSQEGLARRADVSLNVVSRLERGEIADPHISTLTRIADGLGVAVSTLLEEPGKSPTPSRSSKAELADALTAKTVEVNKRYRYRAAALDLLCKLWESRVASLDENLERLTLEEIRCLTEFFLQAAVDETVEIAAVLISGYPEEPNDADVDAALKAAQKSSLIRPEFERWERIVAEVEKLGGAAVTPHKEEDEVSRQRAKKLRLAS
jgi:transcriptional regulator with XRE-family HTH domain